MGDSWQTADLRGPSAMNRTTVYFKCKIAGGVLGGGTSQGDILATAHYLLLYFGIVSHILPLLPTDLPSGFSLVMQHTLLYATDKLLKSGGHIISNHS